MENGILWLMVALIGLVVLALILFVFISWLNDFTQALKHINCEIERTEGREQRHWKKARRRLWLSLIPFIKF